MWRSVEFAAAITAWLYDVEGRVLEMPCEAPGYAERRQLEHPAYPVMEFGGLVFTYMGPPDKQPLLPMLDMYDLRGRHDVVLRGMRIWKDFFIAYVRDCNWLQVTENVLDPWHIYSLHMAISGPQFTGALGGFEKPQIEFEQTPLGARYRLECELPTGNHLTRCSELIIPNMILIPNLYEPGTASVERDKASEVTWAVPIDDTHVRALTIVAWPLRGGRPDPGWRPRIDTNVPERPGFEYERPYEERQRKPDDREAQEGQRPISIHALENLVSSDRGVVMFRRRLHESLELIARGKDPLNVIRDPEKNRALDTGAFNTVRPPTPKRASAASQELDAK